MYRYIVNHYYRKGKAGIPDWMQHTRLETLHLLDLWLDDKFYDKIELEFHQEQSGGNYNPIYTRAPSMKNNLPSMLAGLCARKIFGGRHTPRLKHDNDQFLLNVQALVDELRLPSKMLEAVKRGSVGSVLILFKMLAVPKGGPVTTDSEEPQEQEMVVKGSVEVVQTQYCTPIFNQFEELRGVMLHYVITGGQALQQDLVLDADGDTVEAGKKYWYVKMIDSNMECVYLPIKEWKWNPMNGGRYSPASSALKEAPLPNNPLIHNLGFVQGVWIKNLPGGTHPEGRSTWASALDNFIQFDYISSQLARGLNYSCAPQLVIKGDFRAEVEGKEADKYRDPGFMLRLASDSENGMQEKSSGHDAFLLETNGQAAKGAEDFLKSLKRISFEQLCTSRKDLESISGTMSGKAIELIDQDFIDLIEELQGQYGTCGYLAVTKKLCKAASIAGHPLMVGVSDELIDGLDLDFPPMYLPDPQEVLYLVQAMVAATQGSMPGPKNADGSISMVEIDPLITPEQAQAYLAKQLDLIEDSADKAQLTDTVVNTAETTPPAPQPTEQAQTNNLDSGIYGDLAVKPMTGLDPSNIPY